MRSEEDVKHAIQQHGDTVRRLCMVHLKNYADTEDIFQTVFLKYVLYPGAFDSEEHEKAWIIRTAVNACKDVLKSAWRTRTCDITACAEMAAPEGADGAVMAAVQSLPDKYRVPIYLHYYEGYKTREIAEMLGERPATINTRLDRGRDRLKRILGGKTCEQGV